MSMKFEEFAWKSGDRVRLKVTTQFWPDTPRGLELRARQYRGQYLRMDESDEPGVCWVEFESPLGEARVMVADLEGDPDPTPLRFQTVQEKLQREAMGRALEQAFAASRAAGKPVHVDVVPILENVRKTLS